MYWAKLKLSLCGKPVPLSPLDDGLDGVGGGVCFGGVPARPMATGMRLFGLGWRPEATGSTGARGGTGDDPTSSRQSMRIWRTLER